MWCKCLSQMNAVNCIASLVVLRRAKGGVWLFRSPRLGKDKPIPRMRDMLRRLAGGKEGGQVV